MIRINLTPVEELENQYWWVPDLVVLAALILVSFGGVYMYLDMTKREIGTLQMMQSRLLGEIDLIRPDLDRHDDLTSKIGQLESKKTSLLRITESKMVRFLPLVLLESLQILKPEGLWFRRLGFVEESEDSNDPLALANANEGNPTGTNLAEVQGGEYPVRIELVGQAFDNIIVAEFMTALKSTENQPFERSDVRTHLYFSQVQLGFAEIANIARDNSQGKTVDFNLVLSFRERTQQSSDRDARLSRFIEEYRTKGQARVRF